MRYASIRDLRAHTKELLDAANRGVEIVITRNGKEYARLVPIEETVASSTDVFGMWNDNANVKDVDKFIKTIRKPRNDFS